MAGRLKEEKRLTCAVPGVAATMVTVKPLVCVMLPQVPTNVTVLVPAAVEASAVKVRMLVLAPEMTAGLEEAVTPLGRLLTERLTTPLNPLIGWALRRTSSWPPTVRLRPTGVA